MKLPSGHRVLHFERIDSTNAEARRLAEEGELGPLWIWADEQSAGRGRLGRSWVSEPGNLYATFLFALKAAPAIAAQAGFVASLAVHDTVTALRPDASCSIKWPNDVLIGGAKLAGILAEAVGTAPARMAIGIGLNLAHAPQGTPYPATALGVRFPAESVLRLLAANLSSRLAIWDEGKGFEAIRQDWEARAIGLGERVETEDGTTGSFRGLAADGALLLERADGTRVFVHAGEVRFAALERLRTRTI